MAFKDNLNVASRNTKWEDFDCINMDNITSQLLLQVKDKPNIFFSNYTGNLPEPILGYWWYLEGGGGDGDGDGSYSIYSMRKYIRLDDETIPSIDERYIIPAGSVPRRVPDHDWNIVTNFATERKLGNIIQLYSKI